ncbi:MAG: glucosamine-6-phosphate deaminase [Oscillospiraceae bacterium]|nr:glucosamine-6-phosphate deaminase [Oscillospiraceae bacterium]
MKLIIGTQEEVIKKAAQRYVKLLNEKPEAVLGLATGSTPLGLYAELVKLCAEGKISFAKCTTFNLDEYIGLDGTHDQSYRYFMNKNLFEKVDIRMEATHVPSGAVKSDEEAEQYDAEIKAAGGIDLQLLGIGNNGHIGFNEPLTPFTSMTHIVKLTDSTREANKRFFASIDDVPTHAVTMGIHTVMQAKSIILMAFGEGKAEIIKKTVEGRPEIAVPASLLQLHDDVELYLDEAAASKLS